MRCSIDEMVRRLSHIPHDPRVDAAQDSSADSFGGLADVLEPPPGRSAEPFTPQDFAFADTVLARQLGDEPPPPSRPIFVHDPGGQTQCVTPLAFPVPDAAPDASLDVRMRVSASRMRLSMHRSIAEVREAWDATAELALPELGAKPPSRAAVFLKRIVAVFSSWEWDTADLARAVIIGSAVFLVAGTIGVTAMTDRVAHAPEAQEAQGARAGQRAQAAQGSASAEVRAPRTLDQRTGRAVVVRHRAPH